MVLFAAFLIAFIVILNPSCKTLCSDWGGWMRRGRGLGPTLAAACWYIESANLRPWPSLVSSLYTNGKDFGHPRRKTSLSPVAFCFVELEPV